MMKKRTGSKVLGEFFYLLAYQKKSFYLINFVFVTNHVDYCIPKTFSITET
uniref:Uncharacterized protein n=1 Tax=Nelumbo nucifera TaxID=4432 RepID=A0A822Y5T4_NELNU|nr:TPA_asm: hypothetical protein HUJ06_028459 [Nelumbo nucifera]